MLCERPVAALAWRTACLGLVLGWSTGTSASQETLQRMLIVGTKEAAPFSFKDSDGRWRGISIDLWRSIAEDLNVDYEFQEVDLNQLVSGLADRTIDVGVAALTVTPEREAYVDFTHPFHPSGLGIAVPARTPHPLGLFRGVFSTPFLRAAGALVLFILAAGFLVWLFERRRNPQFGGNTARGIGSGFWWSAVTMTTVGYGDKVPVTAAGRSLAVLWMFAGVITISGFTAAIASTLTVAQLEHDVPGPADLPKLGRIATVKGSTSRDYLQSRLIAHAEFDTPDEALQAVVNGKLQAAVYDAPILRHLVLSKFRDRITVAPATFERQDYAFGVPIDSPIRRPINKVLVEKLSEPEWDAILVRHLGEPQ